MCRSEVILDSAHPGAEKRVEIHSTRRNSIGATCRVCWKLRVPRQAGINEEQRDAGGRMTGVESKEDYRTGPIVPRDVQVVQDQSAKKVASRLTDLLCVEARARELKIMTRTHDSKAHTAASLSPLRPVFSLAPHPSSCILHFLWWARFFCGAGRPFYATEKPEKSRIARSFTHLSAAIDGSQVSKRDCRPVFVAKCGSFNVESGGGPSSAWPLPPHHRRRSRMRPVWSHPVGPRPRCPL